MLQQIMTSPGVIEFHEVPVPAPADDEILIKMMKIGICGSDIHVYHGKHPFTSYPVTQGHEVSGEIVKLGKNISGFHVGQKVTVQPQVTCGKVYAPFDGKCENLIDSLHAMGLVSDNGVEMLIHVGLETVALKGAPFTPHIKTGDSFKKGDLLLEFDIDAIKAAGYETQTPVIVTNAEDVGGVTVEGTKLIIGG